MARVTARSVFAKTRAKRRDAGVVRPRNGIRQRYLNQPLQIADSNSQQSVSSGATNQTEDSMQPSTSTKKRARSTRNTVAEPNWKITDFFAVLSKGRENVPKSPQQIARAQRATNRLRHSLKPKCSPNSNAVLITIIDSDDNNDNEEDYTVEGQSQGNCRIEKDIIHQDDPKNSLKEEIKFKVEPCNMHLSQTNKDHNKSFDEEIEIVTILPPIPLRDHPLLELED